MIKKTQNPRKACHKRRGPSSIWVHDPNDVFDALRLKPGDRVLDLGCGPGDYALRAAKMVKHTGDVFALDKDQHLLDALAEEANASQIGNIKTIHSDMTKTLTIENGLIDVCLLVTVLHFLRLETLEKSLLREIRRVLKPGGRLAIIELKKEEKPFGPPTERCLTPDEIEKSVSPFGFRLLELTDLGYTYMIQFATRQYQNDR